MFNNDWIDGDKLFNDAPRIPFMKLQSGKNVCRIASNFSKVNTHWEKTRDGKQKKITCIDTNCPLCKLGHTPSTRYQMKVLDKTDPDNVEAKILEVGATVIRQIIGFAKDEDYGDPTQYDIKIQKEGTGRDTRYSVTASPRRSEISTHEQELVDALPSMEEINKILPADEIKKMNLDCFDNDDDDFGSSEASAKKSKALDDWENL